jgi:hypothetical protein
VGEDTVQEEVSSPRMKETPTGGTHLSVEERGRRRTLLGQGDVGPRASSSAGPNRFPGLLFYSFSFSHLFF